MRTRRRDGGTTHRPGLCGPAALLALASLAAAAMPHTARAQQGTEVHCPPVRVSADGNRLVEKGRMPDRSGWFSRYESRLTGVEARCVQGTGGIDTTVTVTAESERGQAWRGGDQVLPLFLLAIGRNGEQLERRSFQGTFREQEGEMATKRISMFTVLPTGRDGGGVRELLVGFDLTDEQREWVAGR